jgi:hypothetical protein
MIFGPRVVAQGLGGNVTATPLQIVIELTANGRKWIARLGDRAVCESASPFVKSARLLLAEGYPADTVIEMWRPNTREWALRGRLGAVAATIIDGETGSRSTKNGSPACDPEQGGHKRAASLRSSSGRSGVDDDATKRSNTSRRCTTARAATRKRLEQCCKNQSRR